MPSSTLLDSASQVCKNSRQLGKALGEHGIKVKYSPWYSYSHQVHLSTENEGRFGNFHKISQKLEENGIITDREGRIGTAEITRMGYNDMGNIASLIEESLLGKDVKYNVKELRKSLKMKYCR